MMASSALLLSSFCAVVDVATVVYVLNFTQRREESTPKKNN
jgi:hypothetical protein